MSEMIRVGQEHGSSVLLAVEVEPSQVANYGVLDVEATDDDRVKKVVGMVEKPAVWDASSNLVATGCYLLDRAIFGAFRRITPGKGGEVQLTDAIALLISEGHPSTLWSMMAFAMISAIPPALFPPASSLVFGTRSRVRLCSPTWRPCWKSIGARPGRGLGKSRPRGEKLFMQKLIRVEKMY